MWRLHTHTHVTAPHTHRTHTKKHMWQLGAGEQSDTFGLLRLNDRKSRHRRIKKQRRYERLAATSQLSLW